MYLQELIEDRSKQSGARFYPSYESESYIIVRRAGTEAHRKAEAAISAKYPPLDLLSKEAQREQLVEKTTDIIRDYFVVDMVGFKDAETDELVNYKKYKAQIFSGENSIGLMNSILSFANDLNNYSQMRNATQKKQLEKYIKVNIIEEADDQDWLAFYHSAGKDRYEETRGQLTSEQNALLHVYFELKRDARGELITRKEAAERALSVDYDIDDCIDIILHIDNFYTKCQNEKLAKKAEK